MPVELITAADPLTVVSLQNAKDFLRIDDSTENDLITEIIKAAAVSLEEYTERALIPQVYKFYADTFPADDKALEVPVCPLISVSALQYYTGGVLTTLSSAAYLVDTQKKPGQIALADGYGWPAVDERPNAVVVSFSAGYASAALVPRDLRLPGNLGRPTGVFAGRR